MPMQLNQSLALLTQGPSGVQRDSIVVGQVSIQNSQKSATACTDFGTAERSSFAARWQRVSSPRFGPYLIHLSDITVDKILDAPVFVDVVDVMCALIWILVTSGEMLLRRSTKSVMPISLDFT